jgi:hypothetical protein
VRGDIVTLCPPVGLAPQAPLYQLPEHARHPLGPQVAATGDGGFRAPGHETGLVVAVTQGSFSCVNTLLVCTEKGTLVQSPANWSTAAAAESQTQRQRLEDLSSLTCAMYLHHSASCSLRRLPEYWWPSFFRDPLCPYPGGRQPTATGRPCQKT